jgi:prevent-host-death family protein
VRAGGALRLLLEARGLRFAVAEAGIEVYSSRVHMAKTISIVAARRDLGRLADEVRRSGQAIVLTRRGRPVARLVPQPASSAKPASQPRPFAGLRGSVKLLCTPDELLRTIRELRREVAASLQRRGSRLERSPRRRRA